jgi:hypothetical protein
MSTPWKPPPILIDAPLSADVGTLWGPCGHATGSGGLGPAKSLLLSGDFLRWLGDLDPHTDVVPSSVMAPRADWRYFLAPLAGGDAANWLGPAG